MSPLPRDPSLTDVLEFVGRTQQASIWTCLPGIVESYDVTEQKASVRPAVDNRIELADGEELIELPVIPDVPVVHPSGGGFFVSFPLAKGDPVILLFASRSLDAWLSGDGGSPVDPDDFRMHDLTDAIAIPGGRPFKAALVSASADDLVVGKDDGTLITVAASDGITTVAADGDTTQFVALGGKTDTELQAVQTELDALKTAVASWVPVPQDGGASLKAVFSAWTTHTPATVAATKFKTSE